MIDNWLALRSWQLHLLGIIGTFLNKFQINSILDSVRWDEKGLAVAIAQNVDSGAILMQGFANRDALATTITSKKATFYSRSRSTLWTKGETSLNFISVHDIFLDCDRDSVSSFMLKLLSQTMKNATICPFLTKFLNKLLVNPWVCMHLNTF